MKASKASFAVKILQLHFSPFSYCLPPPSLLHYMYLLTLLFLHVCNAPFLFSFTSPTCTSLLLPAGLQEGSHVQCHPVWSHHSGTMSGALHRARNPLQGGSMVRTHSQTGLGMRLKHPAAKLSILVPPNLCCMLWDKQPATEAKAVCMGLCPFY